MYICTYISSLSTLYTRTSKYVTTDEEHQKSIFAGICITIWYFMLQIKSFKIWSKIIERCLIKSNCFPICYDFFWFVFTKNSISRNFLNPLKSKIYLVGNWKDAFTLGDDALAASEFERLEVSEAVGLDALEKSGMI